MIAWHGSPVLFDRFEPLKLGVRRMGSEGHGLYLADHYEVAAGYGLLCYEVEIPDGPYIDNDRAWDQQPAPARTILADGLSRQIGYRKFRIEDAFNQDIYSQIGQLLRYCRQDGNPLEPALIEAGYKGCEKFNATWREFVVFDPDRLRILSVTHEQRMTA
ncbi:hypothetical protein [Mesorhizobium sp. M8A.F.Ca.ET.165.01.1.1]|uniref:hypothetical protein n=1 Tax=Mesorhizobium sp. M8A.F.Ca.ET.165.01.1.1 TaxID=2563960 RepID=UPI0010938D45|nr:hypothetical protein [Mesorhizobium sp. M8A.F.Ca.ET.165.01.1.1]TGT35688.1 hypothetical protein EN808_31890 [Mesorhizobium sp. M8A.F.Ca.ET.165.01.1.1]